MSLMKPPPPNAPVLDATSPMREWPERLGLKQVADVAGTRDVTAFHKVAGVSESSRRRAALELVIAPPVGVRSCVCSSLWPGRRSFISGSSRMNNQMVRTMRFDCEDIVLSDMERARVARDKAAASAAAASAALRRGAGRLF
jgi:hypothetical protein